MPLFWIIAMPLFAALSVPWLMRLTKGRHLGIILSFVPFSICAALLLRGADAPGEIWAVPWLPQLGMDFALKLSGFETLFAALVGFIGGWILIYGEAYLKGHPQIGRFYLLILLFMMSMLGLILADDLMVTFVFWELTSVTSFLLIGFNHGDAGARKAALKALLVTGGGGLAMLVGFLLLISSSGMTRISQLAEWNGLTEDPAFMAAAILIFFGAFTKSAQVPFHFWLPGAMSAPTPVSAYLHSATMVKAGVILLAKLSPAMSHTAVWQAVLVPVGAATLLTAAVMSVMQTDLKRLLAYSTVSMLGAMVLLIGFGDAYSLKAALFLALVHGLYKGALFMVAGTLDHSAGTRDVRGLSGLGKTMPWLAVAGVAAAIGMSGLPPSLGFISKELMYEANLAAPFGGGILVIGGVVAGALGMAVALITGVRPFFGTYHERKDFHAPGIGLWAPPVMLALPGIVFGCFPGWLDKGIISPAAAALGADASLAKLVLWHGWTPVLALSAATMALGLLIYRQRERLRHHHERLARWQAWTPTSLYHVSLEGVLSLAAFLTGWIQHGQLRIYIRVILISSAAMVLYSVVLSQGNFSVVSTVEIGVFEFVVVLLLSASAIAAARAQSRLSAILCLGGVGYAMALLFVAYGAPDLAVTQLLVETLTVVLFSFVILKLPQIRILTDRRDRFWDMIVASVAGVAMTLVVWKSVHVRVHEPISPGLVERSLTEGYGRNVVNVILVDFRALDTLGEITVLALACLGVTALLARHHLRRPRAEEFTGQSMEKPTK